VSGRRWSTRRVTRGLAIAAVTLGTLALLAGSPVRRASVDVATLAGIVEREEDHVTAVELARWIKDRRPGLRIFDIRSDSEYRAFHVPGAERATLSALVEADFPPGATVVLYSEGGTHAAQGWFFLRSRGLTDVYFLRGGLFEWLDQIMEPKLPAHATPEQQRAFQEMAALSRWFGGTPSIGDPDATGVPASALPKDDGHTLTTRTSDAIGRIRRRGC
jgi:rhodanese-related sulfurtransferase